MSNLTSTIQGDYSLNTFQTLRDLWQQMTAVIGGDVRSVTDADLANAPIVSGGADGSPDLARRQAPGSILTNLPQFSLLQSSKFQALLIGQVVELANIQQMKIEIIFAPSEIDEFIRSLLDYLPSTVRPIDDDGFVNDSSLQSHFTQLLVAALAGVGEVRAAAASGTGNRPSERELQLQQQIAQAHLLNYISTQIHQTLDLTIILQATVEQVQTFLHADRLLIYQFEFAKVDGLVSNKGFDAYLGTGKVTYEALGIPNLSSVLNITQQHDCFSQRQLWDKYQSGMAKAVDLVELEYAEQHNLLGLMQQCQVKSKLVIPIVVNRELWGLLIAHQCQLPRQWQVRETEFLQQVAEHLAFAIHQSELYAASLWHTQSLEQRVNERTQELRDAVIVAQTANQSKTEFLALLSHELRTPLTSILGLSATLLRLPSLNLTDRQQNYLQTIHNSGEHLSELIDDILDFYKLEVGKTFLKVSEFSLSKLIKQVIEIVRSKAEQGKIELEVQIINNGDDVSQVSGRDLRFRGDTKRIRQILLNILINAIKFTPEHGTIIVRAWLEDRYAIFEVEDSGIGIEEEQIPRLFKKFHQLNPTYDRNYAGMGLGLAITQQLVELHGGWIDVDSILGSGSTFTVRIASQPLKLPERNDWDEMDRKLVFQDPEFNPIPKRIILIEHDEDIANFICDILTAARYQVTWLLSAESSFRQISMFQPDLLIIDLTIAPEIVDRLIHNIRNSSTIGDTRMLALASKDDIFSPAVKQYIDDYLWKQVNPEQLLRKITKLLSTPVMP
jgi:two-component system, sensor histidine kinase and response regulator